MSCCIRMIQLRTILHSKALYGHESYRMRLKSKSQSIATDLDPQIWGWQVIYKNQYAHFSPPCLKDQSCF